MTAEMWFDIAVCVLCSVFGGLIVGTFSEFVPMRPSLVRRWVLVTFWILFVSGAVLVVMGLQWGENGVIGGSFGLIVLGVLLLGVITSALEEGKEAKGWEVESWQSEERLLAV